MDLQGKCVLLGVTGGIAAYKMANVAVRRTRKKEWCPRPGKCGQRTQKAGGGRGGHYDRERHPFHHPSRL